MNFWLKIFLFILLLNFKLTSAQQSIPINEIENRLIQNKKHIILELYTDWCGICAIQDKKIKKNEELVSMLENKFYFVKFDAESTESFILNGINFENKDGKIHEFAKAISSNSSAFPGWIIMNPDFEIIFQYNGLIETENFKSMLLELNEI